MPEGRAQFLTHHTEPLVWLPNMLDHPNGAEALDGLWIAADDPAEVAARYARFTGRSVAQEGPVTTIHLDRGWLAIATPLFLIETYRIHPMAALPGFTAASVRVRSLSAVEKCLDASGLSYRRYRDAAVIVDALGSALVFHTG